VGQLAVEKCVLLAAQCMHGLGRPGTKGPVASKKPPKAVMQCPLSLHQQGQAGLTKSRCAQVKYKLETAQCFPRQGCVDVTRYFSVPHPLNGGRRSGLEAWPAGRFASQHAAIIANNMLLSSQTTCCYRSTQAAIGCLQDVPAFTIQQTAGPCCFLSAMSGGF
jgi:hypothetical protein